MTNSIKFVAVTEEVQEAVIWVDDVEASIKDVGYTETMDNIMDRVLAGDLKVSGSIHVIDDNAELAGKMATALEAQYNKEMKLMEDAKKAVVEVNAAIENTNTKGEKTMKVTDNKKALAKKFLEAAGAEMVNAKKAPAQKEEATKTETTKEEKAMKKTTMGGRRKLAAGKGQVEEAAVENNTKEEEVVNVNETKKETPRRRKSSAGQTVDAKQTRVSGTPARKLGRSESIKGEFKKHEGNWYTNKTLYPVLDRFEDIINNMAEGNYVDAELGIETIVFVEPTDIKRYENREDILVVIQVKANGNVLEFPIKEASETSNSDLSSSSIGWIQTKRGLRPAFGFYRPNAMEVKAKCSCGNEFTANTGNMYCWKCRTRHDDVVVSADHNLSFDFAGDWVFQTVPNMVVPTETLALIMALAQYDADLPMEGLLAE